MPTIVMCFFFQKMRVLASLTSLLCLVATVQSLSYYGVIKEEWEAFKVSMTLLYVI